MLKKDSTDITDNNRQTLLEYCQNALIVSMLLEKFVNTDADFNLGLAVGAAQLFSEGVWIAMNGRVLGWDNYDKDVELGQFLSKNI